MSEPSEVDKLRQRISELEQQLAAERDEFQWDLKATRETHTQVVRKMEEENARFKNEQERSKACADGGPSEDVKLLTQRALISERKVAELQHQIKRTSQQGPGPFAAKEDTLLRERMTLAEREREELRREKRTLERELEEKKTKLEELHKELGAFKGQVLQGQTPSDLAPATLDAVAASGSPASPLGDQTQRLAAIPASPDSPRPMLGEKSPQDEEWTDVDTEAAPLEELPALDEATSAPADSAQVEAGPFPSSVLAATDQAPLPAAQPGAPAARKKPFFRVKGGPLWAGGACVCIAVMVIGAFLILTKKKHSPGLTKPAVVAKASAKAEASSPPSLASPAAKAAGPNPAATPTEPQAATPEASPAVTAGDEAGDEDNLQNAKDKAYKLLRKNQFDKLLTLTEKGVKKYPGDAAIHYLYGRALFYADNLDQAINELEKALSLNKGLADAYFELGGVYLKMGKKKPACDALNEFVRRKPDDSRTPKLKKMLAAKKCLAESKSFSFDE